MKKQTDIHGLREHEQNHLFHHLHSHWWQNVIVLAMPVFIFGLFFPGFLHAADTKKQKSDVQIEIDLSSQTLTWRSLAQVSQNSKPATSANTESSDSNGVVTKTFRVSTGKPSTPTPTSPEGKPFAITQMESSHTLQELLQDENVAVKIPYWMTIIPERGIAIHGVKEIWGGQYPGSGACIRMRIEDAKWVFERVGVGTKVTITGSEKDYLAKNEVYPWQREGEKDLIEPCQTGGYQFKKTITAEMAEMYRSLISKGRLGIYKPLPSQISADKRWKKGLFVNFPNIVEMGVISEQTFDQCQNRYLTIGQLESILGGKARIRD